MAYEKYITKNGKTYGPYIYQSKRVDGKVISEYIGPQDNKPKRKIPKKPIFFIIGTLILLAILLLTIFNNQLTGRIVVDVQGELENSQITSGIINFVLKEGELLPSDSKIIIENENQTFTYDLRNLIGSQQTFSGNYFLEDQEISGSGEGIGLPGEYEEFPEIKFNLILTPKEESPSENNLEENTTQENETTENPIQIPTEENETIEEIIEEPETQEETPIEKEIPEEPIPEQTTQEVTIEIPIEQEPTPEPEPTPITGNVVSNTFTSIGSFLTGFLTQGSENEIEVTISKENPFTYNGLLENNYEIENITSNGEQISIEELIIYENANTLTISTYYSIKTKGFGEEYLRENTTNFTIDLTQLNIQLIPGDITIIFENNGTEIFSFTEELTAENLQKIEIENPIVDLGEELFNLTLNSTIEEIPKIEINLTDEEKTILKAIFDFPVVQTKVNTYKDKFLVDFTIGESSMQKAYENSLDEQELENLIEIDQILWLKDIINSHNNKETPIEDTNISYNYPIF